MLPHKTGSRSLACALFTMALPIASIAADCPSFEGTYTGVDMKKVEFTTTIKQKACESIEFTDSRSKNTITYALDGKVAKDPQYVKEANNATHLRSLFVGELLFIEKFRESEVDKKVVLEKTATLILYLKGSGEKRVLNATMIEAAVDRDKAPNAISFDMGTKK